MIWWQWLLVVAYLLGVGFFFWHSFWDDSENTQGFVFLGILWPIGVAAGLIVIPLVWVGKQLGEWRTGLIARKREVERKKGEAVRRATEGVPPPSPPKDVLFQYAPERYDPLAYDDGTDSCRVHDGLMLSRDPKLERVVLELVLGSTDAKRHDRVLVNASDLKEMAHGLLLVAKKLEEGQGEPYR